MYLLVQFIFKVITVGFECYNVVHDAVVSCMTCQLNLFYMDE